MNMNLWHIWHVRLFHSLNNGNVIKLGCLWLKEMWKFFSNCGCPSKEKVIWSAHFPPVSYAASEGAVHQLHQGAAVEGVVPGPHAALQWSGPRGWGHSAASRTHLPGHTSQHRPVQLGEVQHNVCASVRQETRAHSCIDGYFFLSRKSESVFSPIDLMSWSGLEQKKMLCSIQLVIRLISILTVLPFRKQE